MKIDIDKILAIIEDLNECIVQHKTPKTKFDIEGAIDLIEGLYFAESATVKTTDENSFKMYLEATIKPTTKVSLTNTHLTIKPTTKIRITNNRLTLSHLPLATANEIYCRYHNIENTTWTAVCIQLDKVVMGMYLWFKVEDREPTAIIESKIPCIRPLPIFGGTI